MSKRAERRRAERAGVPRDATPEQLIAHQEERRRKLLAIVEESIRNVREYEALVAETRALAAGEETFVPPPPSLELLEAVRRGLGEEYADLRTE